MTRQERIARRAPHPPMGWNSWDSFGSQVTEDEVRAHADIMAERLRPFGWEYIVIDIQWYEPEPRAWADGAQPPNTPYEVLWASAASGLRPHPDFRIDEFGRLLPTPKRFPSAESGKGFGPLADYAHSKGLKFGLHIMRGVPRVAADRALPIEGSEATCADIADPDYVCPWNADNYGIRMDHPGGQAYYDSIVRLYASWGVDFIKADNLLDGPFAAADIEALADAIDRCGRPIVLSLSPCPSGPERAAYLAERSNMYRTTTDFWDFWERSEGYPAALNQAFEAAAPWAPYIREGHWPDLDMLALGVIGKNDSYGVERETRLTKDEQTTLMTLWCIARSPLMFGGDLMKLDAFTEKLLTNPEVLAVQRWSGSNREIRRDAAQAVWAAEDPTTGGTYVALFNRSDDAAAVGVDLAQLGLTGPLKVRDLWRRTASASVSGRFERGLPPHGAGLYRLG